MADEVKSSAKPAAAVKPRWEYKHPVLKMMGIPRIRIPSRNWLIFYSVTGALVSAYYYDREQRKKIRNKYIAQVEQFGQQPLASNESFRKVRVYLAPPPNDYLEPSLEVFRNYIKPILNAAAVDHEVISEERQGHIRSRVAEEIRHFRFNTANSENSDSDSVPKLHTDGSVIVGRGAYKEYMNGIHEGWLGSLEAPADVQEKLNELAEKEKDRLQRREESGAKSTEGADQSKYESESDYEEDKRARLNRQYPVIPAYIQSSEYANAAVPELYSKVEQDPISVFEQPHLLGILMAPVRIYRWLNERYLAEELGQQAVDIVKNARRPYTPADADLALTDEEDWPNKFKEKGLESNSEWMREFVVDPRITEKLEVYTNKTT